MSRSVRLYLNLWYVMILTLILGFSSVLFYFYFASSFLRQTDSTLRLRADGIADTVFAFWRAEHLAAGSGPGNWQAAPSGTFEGDIDQGELSALLGRWAAKTGNLDTGYPIRLISRSGEPLGASPGFSALENASSRIDAISSRLLDNRYQTLQTSEGRMRLVTHPVVSLSGKVLYYVQYASSLKKMDASLNRLRTGMAVFVPLLLLFISTIGVVLVNKALWPIRKVINQARQFTSESLHERMELPQTNDEFEQLDVAFNDMLVRMDRAFRRLRQFGAAASHELRTPLTVMKGEIQVALRRVRSTEEYQRVLQTQLAAVDDMTQTVEELLRLAQTEAVEGEVQWKPVDFSELASRTCKPLKTVAKKKKTRIQLLAGDSVLVRGDRKLLERLIANLIDNAIKHTPPEGIIQVRIEPAEEEARLIVRDNGSGIPEDQMPQLFEQFFNRRPVDGNHSRSTGLGLGLCRWIVELHRGRIDVASTPGEGTTITVCLPLAPLAA